jgi:dihydroorotate dehydrogenase (NAD+) catalytic subunit
MARVCEGEGADGISLINAVQALDIDIERRRPVLWNGLGGLSGPAIQPIALRMVWQCARAVQIPVCGIGGISSAEDVVKFLMAGATAVQVGTANYLNPSIAGDIVDGLQVWCEDHGIKCVSELVGVLETRGD